MADDNVSCLLCFRLHPACFLIDLEHSEIREAASESTNQTGELHMRPMLCCTPTTHMCCEEERRDGGSCDDGVFCLLFTSMEAF